MNEGKGEKCTVWRINTQHTMVTKQASSEGDWEWVNKRQGLRLTRQAIELSPHLSLQRRCVVAPHTQCVLSCYFSPFCLCVPPPPPSSYPHSTRPLTPPPYLSPSLGQPSLPPNPLSLPSLATPPPLSRPPPPPPSQLAPLSFNFELGIDKTADMKCPISFEFSTPSALYC